MSDPVTQLNERLHAQSEAMTALTRMNRALEQERDRLRGEVEAAKGEADRRAIRINACESDNAALIAQLCEWKEWWDDFGKTKGPIYRQTVKLLAKEHPGATLQRDLKTAERALRSEGYRKSCDIAACNCGDQWHHGGYANERLREISEALAEPWENGKTILQRVEALQRDLAAVREKECQHGT